MTNELILNLVGGILMLLFGVKLAGDGLTNFAGGEIKRALGRFTRNRFFGFFLGIIITFLLQSSSATTVMLVSFVDSGLLSIGQTLGIILGADVGTTLTVQLISFNVHNYALAILGIGLLIHLVSTNEREKQLGLGLTGFGLVFLSISLMSKLMSPLKENHLLKEIFLSLGDNPLLGIIISTALTAIIQSSAATLGLALTLSIQKLINLETAIVIILGANLGTCATAVLSSLKSNTEARQVATAHILFKLAGVIIALPLIKPFSTLSALTADSLPRQIANAHTIFNIGIGVLFLPFTPFFLKLIQWLTPAKEPKEEPSFKPKYLNPELLNSPSLAMAQASREAMRMAETVEDMLKLTLKAFMSPTQELIETIEKMDDKVDVLDRGIRFYLTQLSRKTLTEDEAKRQMEILSLISNLENIGDVIDKNLMELAKKKLRKQREFSDEGKKEIEDFHSQVLENYTLAISAFTARDQVIAQRVIRNKAKIRELEQNLYQCHLSRLEKGFIESFETSSIHLDVLSNFRRINSYITNIVYPIVQQPPTIA